MDGMTDEPDVIIEEYEEVIGNFDEPSNEVESGDAEADSIQEPTSMDRRILTTHTGRPSLRSTNARLAGSQAESKPVVVTPARSVCVASERFFIYRGSADRCNTNNTADNFNDVQK